MTDDEANFAGRGVLVALLAAVCLVATLWVATPAASAEVSSAEVTHISSCLAGNGRVDTMIVNPTSDPALYRIEFEGLSPRQYTVQPGDWWRMPITGRPDRGHQIVVMRNGAVVSDRTVTVSCDALPPRVDGPEVEIFAACRGGNGYVVFQFLNGAADSASYIIEFEGVPNRSTTAAGLGQALRAVTGRPDGSYRAVITSAGRTVHDGPVPVSCDADPEPEPEPLQYACTVTITEGTAYLRFGGDRAYSENLLVDGVWVKTITGLDTYETMAGTEFVVRLRGRGYDGPGGFHAATCDVEDQGRELAPLEPVQGVLMGAYPAARSSGNLSSRAAVAEFESATQSSLDVVQVFNPPHDPAFQVELANHYLSRDKIPMITWKVGPLVFPTNGDNVAARVIAGEFDEQIRQRAREANQINGPFFSRLFHEPDGNYGEAYDLTAENSRAYWLKVQGIFAEEGVTNAVWVWNAARLDADEVGFYPGDDLVDWIGADPYLWIGPPGSADRCSVDAQEAYEPLYDRLGTAFWDFAADHPDKPIMLGEWGTGWREGEDFRDRFIRSALDATRQAPRLKALIYFNSSPSGSCDWVLQNGPMDGLAAYQWLASHPEIEVDVAALIGGEANQ